jgi:hypothetical protein
MPARVHAEVRENATRLSQGIGPAQGVDLRNASATRVLRNASAAAEHAG